MNRIRTAAFVLLISSVLACQPYTWVGGTVFYPPGTDHTNAQYHLCIEVYGERGRAFADRTSKTVHVVIQDGKTTVLEREYRVIAASLRWSVNWGSVGDLRITFFEHGDFIPGGRPSGEPAKVPRLVFSVAFTHDESHGSFVEAVAPAEVLEQDTQELLRENKRHIIEIYFEDTMENQARILRAAEVVAANHSLRNHEVSAGPVGRLAEWSGSDFSVEVQRYDSSHLVAVGLEDYGKPALSQDFSLALLALPGVARTRRFASINFRSRSEDPRTTIDIVKAIAGKYSLSQIESESMFTVAKFGIQDLQVVVEFFPSDGRIKVYVEDFGWHNQFAEIENALRSGLRVGAEGNASGSQR